LDVILKQSLWVGFGFEKHKSFHLCKIPWKHSGQVTTGTPENGGMAGALPSLPFQKRPTGAEVPFHNSIIGNFMVY